MKKIAKILVVLLALSLTLFVVGCGEDKSSKEPAEKAPSKPVQKYCPLDNAKIEETPERVFAVAVDNGPKSEPQTNLGKADLLFELPVEGGINRFLALYYHNQPDTVGPVRSARHPFISLVNSFDAIYVHCGGSHLFYKASETVKDIDEMDNSNTFWRDKNRSAPVNLYTSYENMKKAAIEKGLWEKKETTNFDFYNEKELNALTIGNTTEINIPYKYKPVSYTWDEADGNYIRFSAGKPHMDDADNTQLYADNVVTMSIAAPLAPNETVLLDMKFAGNSGSGVLFQNGTATEITWSMANESSPLKFTLADGSEAKLVTGRTIIQVVPDTITTTYNGGATTVPDKTVDSNS